jgi:chloramphenicol 3-O phosphotransferase
MHHAIAALAQAGNNIVADHVLVERAWVDECAQLFADLPAYLIGVYCPLEVLEQREKARRNRTWGQARAQFSIVHAHTVYDLELDTSVLSAAACAQQIVAQLADDVPPHAWRQLRARTAR